MSNRGLKNHFKFKTKYWQNKQQENFQSLETTIVMGVKVNSPPRLSRPDFPNKRRRMSLKAKKE